MNHTDHKHGASYLAQWQACPGSAFAQQGIPDDDSDDSMEGTMLHAMMADPTIDRSALTGEQLDVLRYALEGEEKIINAVRQSLSIAAETPFEEGQEDERWFRRGLKPLFPGHNDRWVFWPEQRVMVIIDRKFGRKEVTPADSNLQLMAYGVMGWEEKNPLHILVAINQPRLSYEQRITMAEYTPESIKAAKEVVLSIWDGSHNKDGSPREDVGRVAGEDQCRYCLAKLKCDAYRSKYEFLAVPAADGKEQFVARLDQLTDAELDKVFVATKFAGLIESAIKSEIITRMEAGGMSNYEQKPGNSVTKVTDTPKAFELLKPLGLTVGQLISRSKLSLEDVAEDLRTAKGITQKEAKKQVRDAVIDACEVKQNAPSLKRKEAPKQGELL